MKKPGLTPGYSYHPLRRAASSYAFTLIELVVAISILSVILVVGYGSVSQISRGKQLLDDNRDATLVAQAVLRKMIRELALTTDGGGTAQGLIPKRGGVIKKGSVVFAPASSSLGAGPVISFLTENTAVGGRGLKAQSDLIQVSYSLVKDPSEKDPNLFQLVREEMPYLKSIPDAQKHRFTVPVTSRVRSLRFRFFQLSTLSWSNSWGTSPTQTFNSLKLIQMELTLETPMGKKFQVKTSVPLRST